METVNKVLPDDILIKIAVENPEAYKPLITASKAVYDWINAHKTEEGDSESWRTKLCGKYHSFGAPAVGVDDLRYRRFKWYHNGVKHREDGPADTYWSFSGQYGWGYSIWYKNGVKHRETGPAVVYHGREAGPDEWWLNGVMCSLEDVLGTVAILFPLD